MNWRHPKGAPGMVKREDLTNSGKSHDAESEAVQVFAAPEGANTDAENRGDVEK